MLQYKMVQDADYSTHGNRNRPGTQPNRYETFTAAVAETVHLFCRIKKNQLRLQKCMRDGASPRQQRLDIYEVAGVESDAKHANDQRTANCVINTSVSSNRLESVCTVVHGRLLLED